MFSGFTRTVTLFTAILSRTSFKQNGRAFCSKQKKRDVILFPGQGSQYVGMAAGLAEMPAAKQLFEMANEYLGYDLSKMCLHGPKDDLDRTIYCQPAVFVASMAALEKYKESQGGITSPVTAGFSVGELAALVLGEALTFEDALALVDIRAQAMQHASDTQPGGMVTMTGLNKGEVEDLLNKVREFFKKDVEIMIANYLYPKGFVVAGEREAIDRLLELSHGGKMSELAVSGAFHTSLMKYAQPVVAGVLESMNVRQPQMKVYSNVTARPYTSIGEIRRLLPRQLVEPVQWNSIVTDICQSDFDQTFYEIGPGRQLTTILAKLDKRLVRKCKQIA